MKNLSYHQLDDQIHAFVNGQRQDRIPTGWIHATRTAIGMTLKQLASRLGLSVPAVKKFEQREQAEAISLASLRKLAQAMDMDLVYYFKPKSSSVEAMMDARVEMKAKELMNLSHQAMLLENQPTDKKNQVRELNRLIAEIRRQKLSSLWE
ncbi:MAG: helix-turn-helix domain-containing protein [Bacteroidota bacterium]